MVLTRDTYDTLSRRPRTRTHTADATEEPIDPSTVYYAPDSREAIRTALSAIASDGATAITIRRQRDGSCILSADDGRKLKGPTARTMLAIENGDADIPDSEPLTLFLDKASDELKITLLAGRDLKIVASDPRIEPQRRFRDTSAWVDDLITRSKVITMKEIASLPDAEQTLLRDVRKTRRARHPAPQTMSRLLQLAASPAALDDVTFAALSTIPETLPTLAARDDLDDAHAIRIIENTRGGAYETQTLRTLAANRRIPSLACKQLARDGDPHLNTILAANPATTPQAIGHIIDTWVHENATRNFGWFQGLMPHPWQPKLGPLLQKRKDLTDEQRDKVTNTSRIWTRYAEYVNAYTAPRGLPTITPQPKITPEDTGETVPREKEEK